MTQLTAQERRFGLFMLASGVVYGLGGLSFGLLPGLTQAIAAWPGTALGLSDSPPLPAPMWFALGVSMMFTISVCALMCGIDPRQHRPFALPVVVSKGASTVVAALALAAGVGQASAVGVILTDLPLFLATLFLFRSAQVSVNGSWLRGGPPGT